VDVREAVADVLAEKGHDILMASNGAQALAMLCRPPLPTLILLDLMMPVMDGYQFLAECQKDAALASIPVVLLTAGRNVDQTGIEGRPIVEKPFGLLRLTDLVDEL
jgi:CheY-like chemotaxis protein